MGIIISINNFKSGYTRLPIDSKTTDDINYLIGLNEKQWLYQILSNTIVAPATEGLADLFIADCAAHSGKPAPGDRFDKIYQPLSFQIGRLDFQSKGLLYALSCMTYYEFIKMTESFVSQSGVVSDKADAANKPTMAGSFRLAESRWNEAISSIRAIQRWIRFGNGNNGPTNGGYNEYPEYVQPRELIAKFSALL